MRVLSHVSCLCIRKSTSDIGQRNIVEFVGTFPASSSRLGEVTWKFVSPLYRGSVMGNLARMDAPARERAMRQMTEAVSYIHREGFLHRDIKPQNTFIVGGTPGHFLIGDLGLMTAMSARGGGGTPGYVAPESYTNNRQSTPATDVYSLGVSFDVMLDYERYQQLGRRRWFEVHRQGFPPKSLGVYRRLVPQMIAHSPEHRPDLTLIQHCLLNRQDLPDNAISPPISPPPSSNCTRSVFWPLGE